MNDRDRLIELIADIQNDFEKWCVECAEDGHKDHQPLGEYLADKLLQNGVIVPPCKVGDDIWWVSEENIVECQKNGVAFIVWNGKEWSIGDRDGGIDPIGTKWSCLTKEEAEAELRKRSEYNAKNN